MTKQLEAEDHKNFLELQEKHSDLRREVLSIEASMGLKAKLSRKSQLTLDECNALYFIYSMFNVVRQIN